MVRGRGGLEGLGKYKKQLWQCLVMALFGSPESAQLSLVAARQRLEDRFGLSSVSFDASDIRNDVSETLGANRRTKPSYYDMTRRFIMEFDTVRDQIHEAIGSRDEVLVDVEDAAELGMVRDSFRDAHDVLAEIKDAEYLSPGTQTELVKFYRMCEGFLAFCDEHGEIVLEDVSVEKRREIIEENPESLEFSLLCVFQPLLIRSVAIASYIDDKEFLTTYMDLVDRFAAEFAQERPEKYHRDVVPEIDGLNTDAFAESVSEI